MSENLCFLNDLDMLKEYFPTRNYPKHVIGQAVGKVFSIGMDDAIKPTTPIKCQDIIPFLYTYNRSLSNIGKNHKPVLESPYVLKK